MENSASFGDWLRRRRKALDLTQDALAEQVGCSVGLIRKIEGDERRPSRQIAELLAAVLQIPTGERDKFLKVARAQLRTARLDSISAVANGLPQPRPVEAVSVAELTSPPQPVPVTAPPKAALPIPPTPLVGREQEVQTLSALLVNPECRLLTIVGAGGMGKTRLALAVAAEPPPGFRHGVAFVALAPLTAPEFIVPTIANALNVTFAGAAEPKGQLLHYLRDKELLLVLDNLEHLLAGLDLLGELLAACPLLKLLITSRERLQLQSEWVFELQGLPLPATDQGEQLATYSAIALFVTNAQRARPGFALTVQNSAAVVHICRLVEGMPLGIELAAAWVHVLSCQEIAQEIEQSIDFLTVARRDVPERHRSLRAVFDHSWRLLAAEERRVLCALSVFRGGFSRAAAEQVAHASLPTLAALTSRSLLWRTKTGRYDLHELVRQYAATKLAEVYAPGAAENPARSHAHYFLRLVSTAEEKLNGPEQVAWLDQIEQEHDNLRTALEWTRTNHEYETGLRLATGLMWFWSQRDYRREGRRQLMRQLEAAATAAPPLLRAQALNAAAYLAYEENDYPTARLLYEEALTLSRALQDHLLLTRIVLQLAHVTSFLGDDVAARAFAEQAIVALRTVDDPPLVAAALIGLGDLARRQANYAKAQALYDEGITLIRRLQSTNLLAYALRQASHAALHVGDVTSAATLCRESLAFNQAAQSKQGVIACLAVLAAVMRARGQLLSAAQLFGAVAAQLTAIAEPLLPVDQVEYEQHLKLVQSMLDPAAYTTAWQTGQAMTLEQAIAYALAG